MMDSNINIFLNTAEEQGSVTSPETPASSPNIAEPTQQAEKSGEKSGISAAAVGAYVVKQGLQKAAQRVGQVVGSSQLQDQINALGTIAAYGTALAVNPVFGTAMIAINTGFEIFDYYTGKKNEERTLSVIRARAGSSLNRSR